MLNAIRYNLYRFKYNYGQHLNLTAPVDVSLELASHCNMSCQYCYHSTSDTPFNKGFMSMDTAQRILKSSAEFGVNSIKLNWKGESTLNPHFYYITDYARNLAHGSVFQERLTNSNFKFASKKSSIFMGLANQTKVKVSYDSFDKKVFETQRADGKHGLTTSNIDIFYNWPGRKTEIVIQAVRTKLNKNEDIEHLCKKRWPDATVSVRDMVGGRVDSDLSDFTNAERDVHGERIPCKQAFVRLIFNWAGVAFPCCPDIKEQLALGDINKSSIKEIFNSKQAKFLRKRLKNGNAFDSDPCQSCSSFESYAGYEPNWGS